MRTQTNEYETAEVLAIGTSRDLIRGVKDFPAIDSIGPEGPLIYRTDWWPWFAEIATQRTESLSEGFCL